VSGTQEGCHFDIATQATVVGLLRTELDSRGLTSLKIVASDESYFDQAATNLQQTGSTAPSKISKVNVHGYQGTSGRRDLVASLAQAAGKPVWNSEFGDSDGTSIGMVTNMFLDFQYLLPTGWMYWQAVDGGGWGLLDGNNDNGQINGVNVKFYVLSQFTRHIREGMRIVDAGNANAIAAYDSSAEKLFIVAANLGSAQSCTVDLSGLRGKPANGAAVMRWNTVMNGGDNYVDYSDTKICGTSFKVSFGANSIQTFEITGATL
jgi:galactan endo-1,6-beta-galactosidase